MRKTLGLRGLSALLAVLVLSALSAVLACGNSGFDPASKVDSVRLFAVRADKPYAKPGDTVTLEALMTDQRKAKPRAAKLYWIPVLCLNPREDLYYLCFAPPGDGGRQAGNKEKQGGAGDYSMTDLMRWAMQTAETILKVIIRLMAAGELGVSDPSWNAARQ